jgi:glycosyltransferase involved in cell wall biosynthesis
LRINRRLVKEKSKVESFIDKSKIICNTIGPFSIVITYSSNRLEPLKDCFYYLNQCLGIEECEIILVQYQNERVNDDFSEFQSLNIKKLWSKRNNPEGKFCLSHARNIGLQQATKSWVLMLDADVLVPPLMCKLLSDLWLRNSPSYMYICYRMNVSSHLNHSEIESIRKNILWSDTSFSGFWHFFNTDYVRDKIGGYDEKMNGFGREDCDLVMRFLMTGGRMCNISDLIEVYHIPHDYDPVDWKTEDSDQVNHRLQDDNSRNNKTKMEDIGVPIEN